MTGTKFCELSSLVLVDILAALPMEHVVRMARLGHERLRHTCSLEWVKDRMTDVTFEEIFRAYQLRDHQPDTFCGDSVIKKLNGEIKLPRLDHENVDHIDTYVEIAKKCTGRLHLRVESNVRFDIKKRIEIASALDTLPGLICASQTIKRRQGLFPLTDRGLQMVFYYCYYLDDRRSNVYYRPALLNGRHIVDVLRAVCGPADVSEAELDRVRRKATKAALNLGDRNGKEWEGVWNAYWIDVAIVAQM